MGPFFQGLGATRPSDYPFARRFQLLCVVEFMLRRGNKMYSVSSFEGKNRDGIENGGSPQIIRNLNTIVVFCSSCCTCCSYRRVYCHPTV